MQNKPRVSETQIKRPVTRAFTAIIPVPHVNNCWSRQRREANTGTDL